MKLNIFEIVLTNTEAVYFSGQTVQGHVIIELAKNTEVKDLRMSFRGKAFVHWTDQTMRGPGEVRFKEIRHHSATEEYFDVSKSLLSQASCPQNPTDKRVLEAGQYTYPFKFRIPPTSPTSFEGQFGFIRYWTKVTIERPWKKDVSAKKLFSVIFPLDLNQEPTASQPTNNQKEKQLCCLCCTSGPIIAEIRLPQKGYVPGERLNFAADIDNSTRRKVHNITVELLMTTTFHAAYKSRSVTQTVSRIQRGSLKSGNSDSWEGGSLLVPPLPPSFLIGCNIIDVRYTLQLRVFPGSPAFDLTVPIEIMIGSVPLQSTLEYFLTAQNMVLSQSQDGIAISGGASEVASDIRLQYLPPKFLPSPICKHQVHDNEDDQCLMLDNNFVPKYITLNFQPVTSRQ
ncbi:unnamed protein product [Candidula unifasciata]|uniref:Arrestin C-terminal-like domain-containing protein n=1 Tax=Candidula unifasciata TaxID=100452 RepID=A0A8S3ZBL8_9EUPU|nr:unnamed protein product [Candidula unifasciata]